MGVTIKELLQERSLKLTARSSHCLTSEHPISWVSTTELTDPLPFLGGGELVMSTGMQHRSDLEWQEYLQHLADLPVAGLCFGTGLIHQSIPTAVIEGAEAAGLPLLESPVDVPFVQISRWIADRLFAEQYDAVQQLVRIQDDLIQRLLAGGGLPDLVKSLHQRINGTLTAVVRADGRVLYCLPHSATEEMEARHAKDPAAGQAVPILVDQQRVAYLYADAPADDTKAASRQNTLLSFAANILGLEFAKQLAIADGRRELLGQVVEDILNGTVTDEQGQHKLLSQQLRIDKPHHVVVASLPRSSRHPQLTPLSLKPPGTERFPTAVVGGDLLVIVPDRENADLVARDLEVDFLQIHSEVGVGISEPRRGVAGLRLSVYEARHASRRGPGVHRAEPLSLAGLLVGNLGLPLHELAQVILQPLIRHDDSGSYKLLDTLRTFLKNDCSQKATADALSLHRNSLRYRLETIERLTGRNLGALADQFEFALALSALDMQSHNIVPEDEAG